MGTLSTIATLRGEGYPSVITVDRPSQGIEIVRFRGNFDIDADGSNGQNGGRVAYTPHDKGSDFLANVGYPRNPSEYQEGLICKNGVPVVFPGNIYASRTALRMPGFQLDDPRIGVDGEFFPFAVIPPIIRQKTAGICLGCLGTAINHKNGRVADFVVADIGPSTKDGEGSPALARALAIGDDPKTGGMDDPDVEYVIYPGKAAFIRGFQFQLQHA